MQGHYTIQFGGDKNLCRAYMPFECTHAVTHERFSFETVNERKRWIELREGHPVNEHWEKQLKEGWSVWVNPDTGEYWKPTDVHMATTLKALEAMEIDWTQLSEKELDDWRSIGKMFNFARNYGVGDETAAENLEISIEAARAMNRGYSEAFPKVIDYQNWIDEVMWKQNYFEHQMGRRYYLKEHRSFYKVGNYGIQGLCADILKDKMIKIDDYLMENGLDDKVKMVMCIHDELQFEASEEYEWVIWKIKEIMEDTPDILVPIVAEVEKTTTNWASKKKLLAV